MPWPLSRHVLAKPIVALNHWYFLQLFSAKITFALKNMPINDKDTLWQAAWDLLQRGAADGKHPYATPVVATVSADGKPNSRTLVLRKSDRIEGTLWCYTDRRSQKAHDLANSTGLMSWTFWDRKKKIQVNACGPTRWLNETDTQNRFLALPKHSRKSYATLAPPGQPKDGPTDGLPSDWDKRAKDNTDYAREHFGVLITELTTMTVLQLDREGHRRMLATRSSLGEAWEKTWLVP